MYEHSFSISVLRSMVFESTLEQWGDFSGASSFLKQIKNRGMSSRIRFNDEKYAAYVKVIPNVTSIIIIDTMQILTGIKEITFYKDPKNNEWKIFAFGAPVDPIVKM